MKPERDIDLPRIAEALSRHKVEYVIVGGLAVFLHGGETPTTDVDLAFAFDTSNLERLADALQELGAAPKRWKPEGFRLSRTDLAGAWLHLDSEAGEINLIVEAPGTTFQELIASRIQLDIGGASVWVASPESLVKMKSAAGRPRDLRHIEELKAISDQEQ